MAKSTERFSFADEPAPVNPKPQKDHAQLLLDFLQRWSKPTISSRDIRIWGPMALHNREGAIRSAQILAAHGWLIPIAERKWQVVRKPLTPTVERR